MKGSCLACPNIPQICTEATKPILTTPPLPSTSKHFLNFTLQGIYFVKGTLNNNRSDRKLNIKGNVDLAVGIPVEKTSLSQSELIKNIPLPEKNKNNWLKVS